ncbi:SufD family Fe-S cluster assembly protein [Gammaproteobacteria bacterium]|nr:SufD family Fe-S cluster assembly protein [Gammaproteobacteria bacterium]
MAPKLKERIEYTHANERLRLVPLGWSCSFDLAVQGQSSDATSVKTVDGVFQCLPYQQIKPASQIAFYHHPDEFLLSYFPSAQFALKLDNPQVLHWEEVVGSCSFEKYQLIVAQDIEVTLMHQMTGGDAQRCLEIILEPGAKLVHIITMRDDSQALSHHFDLISVAAGASYQRMLAASVSGQSRAVTQIELSGASASAAVQSVIRCTAQAKHYVHCDIYHHGENTQSSQKFQSILEDQSAHLVESLVTVDQAQGACSYQRIDHLMQSDQCKAYSKPALDINVDDVNCEHGATISIIDESVLNYLYARGIDPASAQAMFIDAQINTVYEKSEHIAHLKQALWT